jgi:hypothetical protein
MFDIRALATKRIATGLRRSKQLTTPFPRRHGKEAMSKFKSTTDVADVKIVYLN